MRLRKVQETSAVVSATNGKMHLAKITGRNSKGESTEIIRPIQELYFVPDSVLVFCLIREKWCVASDSTDNGENPDGF